MEGIVNIFIFCILFGTIILCSWLIIYAVLRWLKPSEKRGHRLDILALISFIVLCILAFIRWGAKMFQGDENSNDAIRLGVSLFEFSIAAIKVLLFGTLVLLVIVLVFIVILCLGKGIRMLLVAKSASGDKDTKLSEIKSNNAAFYTAVKSPAAALIIAGGIISLFLIIPFLVTEPKEEGFLETWENGVIKIAETFSTDDAQAEDKEPDDIGTEQTSLDAPDDKELDDEGTEQSSSDDLVLKALATYALLFIILFGVGLAVVEILHSLIADFFQKEKKVSLIDTYANPIVFLSIGVFLFWMLQKENFENMKGEKILLELVKSVGTVMFVAALLILALEVIRFLLDMRQNIIRQETKYIFISLIGKFVLILFEILNLFYGALNSAIGGGSNKRLLKIDKKLKKKIICTMKKAIKKKEESTNQSTKEDDSGETKITFNPFEELVTKK